MTCLQYDIKIGDNTQILKRLWVMLWLTNRYDLLKTSCCLQHPARQAVQIGAFVFVWMGNWINTLFELLLSFVSCLILLTQQVVLIPWSEWPTSWAGYLNYHSFLCLSVDNLKRSSPILSIHVYIKSILYHINGNTNYELLTHNCIIFWLKLRRSSS